MAANGVDALDLIGFKREVHNWARRMEVQPRSIAVREMRRKWGSCSVDGRLTFDAFVLRQPVEVRRQVIVHELLHLKVPNHGKLFQRLLDAYLSSA